MVSTKTLQILVACTSLLAGTASAQEAQNQETSPPIETKAIVKREVSFRHLPLNLLGDQAVIWTSPAHVQPRDANWLVPLGILTGSMIASDRWVPRTLDLSPKTQKRFDQFSNAGLAGVAAVSGGTYLLGRIRHNEYQRRAGFLAGEAMVNALAAGQVLKLSFGRERPGEGSMRNEFWKGGNSFPSDHALLSWSAAAALTEAYPGWGSKLLFYGGATAVSMSRVLANKHAPSDVLVGSTLGYLIGKKVYRRHTVELEIEKQYGTFKRGPEDDERTGSLHRASVYVPLDSWIYSAIDRLIALGYLNSAFVGLRPWTRSECERLIETIPDEAVSDDATARPLIEALRSELSNRELPEFKTINAELESVYFRTTGIAGKPLTNDLDFGGTLVNDYGRPFQQGFNGVSGASAHAEYGPLAFYVRFEYEHAPGAPALPQSALIAIRNGIDPFLPLPPALPQPQIDQVRLLDSYVTWNVANWQLSFGKQSLWWGPGQNGAMLISNNAEPINMVRLDRIEPLPLPGILKHLGPMRLQMFMGRLSGHHFVHVDNNVFGTYNQPLSDQPYVMGQKVSFKLTPNLEIGVSRTDVFGGPVFPLTPSRLMTVFFTSNSTSNAGTKDPGDARTGFDFSYRIPGLRKWLVLYADSMAEDEVNPIAYPRRSAMNPGIYLPQLPKLRKMDLRAEAAYTDLPGLLLSDYFYWNHRYNDGYTNSGHLIGDWVGRQGKALQFSSNYWFSGRNKLQVSYRKLAVNPDTGRRGTQHDFKATLECALSSTLQAVGWVQYERWNFPVLAPTPQSNVTVSVQLAYTPRWRFHH